NFLDFYAYVIKIQKVAKVIAWTEIVLSIIGGVALFFCAFIDFKYLWCLIFLAPIAVVLGCIMAWLSVITLYGFGKLIEDVEAIRNEKSPITKVETEQKQPQKPTKQNDISPKTTNVVEAKQNSSRPKVEAKKEETIKVLPCPECGEDLDFMGWSGEELKEKQICPLCEKEILFYK
ncbi:MAG: hypothetical protein J6R77_06790, partial [Clostridia bacterium]|nr:hypothetical protein [Clostridia bacterium]